MGGTVDSCADKQYVDTAVSSNVIKENITPITTDKQQIYSDLMAIPINSYDYTSEWIDYVNM